MGFVLAPARRQSRFSARGEKWAPGTQACKGANYAKELEQLNLQYPSLPEKKTCAATVTVYPITSSYKSAFYDILPPKAAVKACVATCCKNAIVDAEADLVANYKLDCKDATGKYNADLVGTVKTGAGIAVGGGSYCVAKGLSSFNWGSAMSVCARIKRTADNGKYMGIVTTGFYNSGAWELRMGREAGLFLWPVV